MFGKRARYNSADVVDTQRVNQLRKACAFGFLYGGKKIGYFFILKPVNFFKVVRSQIVQTRRRTHAQNIVKLFRRLYAHAIYVHAILGAKMHDARHDLRAAAVKVLTEQVCAVLGEFVTATRASRRFFYFLRIVARFGNAQNFGNNVVASPHEYARSYCNVFAAYIAVIIERGAFYRRAAQLDRFEQCKRGQLARPSDLPCNVL